MSSSIGNNQFNLDPSEIGLTPPASTPYGDKDVVTRPGGVKLGEGDNTVVADKKKPGAVTDVIEEATVSANVQIGDKGVNVVAQEQIDNLDPANPTVPLLPGTLPQSFVQYLQKMELNSGDVIAALGAQGAEKLAKDYEELVGKAAAEGVNELRGKAAAEAGAPPAPVSSEGIAGNPWMAGTPYTAFLVNMWQLLRVLMRMKEVDGQIQITGMNMMVELAKETADAIMDAAETRFWEHISMAIVDGVSIGVTVASTAGSIAATSRIRAEQPTTVQTKTGAKPMTKAEVHAQNIKYQSGVFGIQTFQALGQAMQSGEKAANNIIQGTMELEAAKYDALKEILQAYRQIQQMQTERMSEAFKQETDYIAQIIAAVKEAEEKRSSMQQKAISRSSA